MKEKRILCIEASEECIYLVNVNTPLLADAFECQQGSYCTKNTAWEPITKETCKNCKHAKYNGITREQAIEKIAKAMCQRDETGVGDCALCGCRNNKTDCKSFLLYFFETAEAALNALLEEKK